MLSKILFPGSVRVLLVTLLLAGMIACTASDGERMQAPPYARPVGLNYSVTCDDAVRREIIVLENRLSAFYKTDGTVMTRDEFCDEYRSMSRIE